MAQQAYEGVTKCPGCSAQDAVKVRFTWWGGMLGAKLTHLAKCNGCGKLYNGVNGKDHSKTGVYAIVVIMSLATIFTIVSLVQRF